MPTKLVSDGVFTMIMGECSRTPNDGWTITSLCVYLEVVSVNVNSGFDIEDYRNAWNLAESVTELKII